MKRARSTNSKAAKKIIEGTRRIGDDLKRALKSAITSNDTLTVWQSAPTNKRQRLENNLVITDEHSSNRAETIVIPTTQHGMGEELNPQLPMEADNGDF